MDYPNDFNVPAFPAGKTIALTRSVSVWISIVFFLIVAACCFILLGNRYKTNYPFLISIDPITDEWNVVTYPDETQKPMNQYKIIQEKLINDFVINWFTISKDKQINDARWMECTIEECSDPEQFNPNNTTCALACKSSSDVFQEFQNNVLPIYNAMINQADETWRITRKQFMPVIVSENGGQWQMYATVQSAVMGQFSVLAFIDVARDIKLYPATFGYYVKQFNSYRISQ